MYALDRITRITAFEENRPIWRTARAGTARARNGGGEAGGCGDRNRHYRRECIQLLDRAGRRAAAGREEVVFVRLTRRRSNVRSRRAERLSGFKGPTVQSQVDSMNDNHAVKCVHKVRLRRGGLRRCFDQCGGVITIDELLAMRAQLGAALGQGTASLETPQLGRVEYRSIAEIRSAIV